MHTHLAIPCEFYKIARHLSVTQPRTFVSVEMIDIAVIYQVIYYRYNMQDARRKLIHSFMTRVFIAATKQRLGAHGGHVCVCDLANIAA